MGKKTTIKPNVQQGLLVVLLGLTLAFAIGMAALGYQNIQLRQMLADKRLQVVDPFAQLPENEQTRYTPEGRRIVSAKEMKQFLGRLEEKADQAGDKIADGMDVLKGTLQEMDRAAGESEEEVDALTQRFTDILALVKGELPELMVRVKSLQQKIEQQVKNQAEKFQEFAPQDQDFGFEAPENGENPAGTANPPSSKTNESGRTES
jgi:hypothetical protein